MTQISFSGTYHFLQNQSGLACAYCGNTMLSENDIKTIKRHVEKLKGQDLADLLTPYLDCYGKNCNSEPLKQLIEYAQNPKNKDVGIKTLALHLDDKRVYSPDMNMLLHNLFNPVLYSADHVVPRSKGGINSYSNFVPMHRSCNTTRSSDSYAETVKEEPEVIDNLNKAITLVQARIMSDKLGLTKFRINIPEDYSQKIADALETQGIERSLIAVA